MFLLDFEKAYDRVEWNFITMMLEAFSFPRKFCDAVNILLKDALAQIDVNGSLSASFPLSRSIRQGCPLAPALFVIAFEALFYILRDNSFSPVVKGITLPNNEELLNCQFADDTAIFFDARPDNFEALTSKLNLFYSISRVRLSHSKSICLGWDVQPPDWFKGYDFQWGGPHKIVRYLGIPFSIDPSLKDMWSWVKDKIIKKLNKWHNRTLSLAGRIQVCQKILSFYNIYYSSAWMFSNYQILEIQKAIRSFLWSDGKGKKKMHDVKWEWCHVNKLLGGLGLKDLKLQGFALAAKWIFHSLDGNDPSKVLVRRNIERGLPKYAKSWKNLPFSDLVIGNFPVLVQGSTVFRSIWKAWDQVKKFVSNKAFHDDCHLFGERSIWWNLSSSGKPLALSQGCSARHWSSKGISLFADLFEYDKLISWEDLRIKFDLPISQKKTYNMIVKASKDLPSSCHVDSHRFLGCKWTNGTMLSKIKAKNIYNVIGHSETIIDHVNSVWYSTLDTCAWKKHFERLWKGPTEPKIKCFNWLLLLNRLLVSRGIAESDYCKFCRLPETARHILLDYIFAKEIWLMFGITYPMLFTVLEIVTGHIDGLKHDSNLFWKILSSNVLWQIWKCRNEERFQNNPRDLTESFRKLTFFKIFLQVRTTMFIERKKLKRFLKDGYATFFIYEMKGGYAWRDTLNNQRLFENTCKILSQEVKNNSSFSKDTTLMLAQIQEMKCIVWMEGDKGWTAWVDKMNDILH